MDRPAGLTSALYDVSPESRERLSWWTRSVPELRVARGTGYYGFGTNQIVMWRSDVLGDKTDAVDLRRVADGRIHGEPGGVVGCRSP
ncbi:hypothetical protein [Streptomyces cyaneofuscatus]|uniref:hypothetical protein n=1 Tax=Streptomyces cyaneofuscatus TaxID=66883 RepID=UPI00339E8234